MKLDFPALLAPKMRVSGRIGMYWVSAKALKFPIRRPVSIVAILLSWVTTLLQRPSSSCLSSARNSKKIQKPGITFEEQGAELHIRQFRSQFMDMVQKITQLH